MSDIEDAEIRGYGRGYERAERHHIADLRRLADEVGYRPMTGDEVKQMLRDRASALEGGSKVFDVVLPDEPRARVALAVFEATRYNKHPANGGEHWNTADRLMQLLPELRRHQ